MARANAGGFGKWVANQIWAGRAKDPNPLSRGVAKYSSSYDKNVEEHVRPAVVPDHVIDYKADSKYWGPHPQTGVFGPADEGAGAFARRPTGPVGEAAPGSSVLDQTAWFRPLEDVDKPPPV